MAYLLDTNACIALINGSPESVSSRFQHAAATGAQISVPSIVAYELWYGVGKSKRPEFNSRRVETFFSGPLHVLPFDVEDAKSAGAIRSALEAKGRPMGAYDVLIAGQAVRHKLTLVTANVREFSRVAGLKWEDWAK